MANVTNLSKGSSGSDVKKLQQALISAGYNVGSTGADGVLGKNTEAAIKQYQKDNGLTVDGIAGKNTQASLYGTGNTNKNTGGNTNTNTGKNTNEGSNKIVDGGTKEPVAGTPKVEEPKTVTSPGGFTYGDFQYDAFDPMADEQIKQAWDILTQNNASKPGEFTDPNGYKDTYMGYLNQYENRDPFSYDFNSDALYQQYKDQFIQQGQLAKMDTMGQAAAMTGGYGNSYAQAVGQQAYNQQLSQLNEIMPELYGMAYDRYNQEGQNLLNMYDTYLGLYQTDYGMHQDSIDRWYQENSRLQGNYDSLYQRGYDNYMLGYNTALNEYNTDRSEEFSKWQTTQDQEFTAKENQKSRDFTAEENNKSRTESQKASAKSDLVNLITSTGYKPTDAELEAAGMTRSQADSYATAYGNSKTSDTTYTTFDYDQQTKWEKKFLKATSLDAVDNLADDMEAAKIDPQIVAMWRNRYAKKFLNKTPIVVGTTGTTGTAGGGGGGVSYWTVK